jgi:mannitol/fructose-specific phosphotransferase system IIA component (Ntr-type)
MRKSKGSLFMPGLNRLFARLTSRAVSAKAQVNTQKKLFELAGSLLSGDTGLDPSLFQLLLAQREKISFPQVAIITLATAIPFDSPDGEPVDLFCCLILPENNLALDNESILHQLTKMLKNQTLTDAICESKNNQELYQSLLMVTVPEDV